MNKIILDSDVKMTSMRKKLHNVEAFSSLDRKGLEFRGIERRLLMKEFPTGEKLYIQYPGKESARENNPRPWDFRPKLLLPNGEWLKDLSFKDVWDDLYSIKDAHVDLADIATIFFRMAYMMDSNPVTRTLDYEDVDIAGNVVNRGKIEFTWNEYTPEPSVLDKIFIPSQVLRGVSLPAYLAYNDYLAQNEDCKYFYRAEKENGSTWDGKVGRMNTLLTHMTVIAFMEDKIKFTDIMMRFQRGKGVAPLPANMFEDITGGAVEKRGR